MNKSAVTLFSTLALTGSIAMAHNDNVAVSFISDAARTGQYSAYDNARLVTPDGKELTLTFSKTATDPDPSAQPMDVIIEAKNNTEAIWLVKTIETSTLAIQLAYTKNIDTKNSGTQVSFNAIEHYTITLDQGDRSSPDIAKYVNMPLDEFTDHIRYGLETQGFYYGPEGLFLDKPRRKLGILKPEAIPPGLNIATFTNP